jgi:hypothetical protein
MEYHLDKGYVNFISDPDGNFINLRELWLTSQTKEIEYELNNLLTI